jgi:hypothetical protein
MTIDVAPETGAQLKTRAQAEGVSISVYVERLMFEAESRRIQLTAFRQTINERVGSLNAGESVDGEEVMARLIAEMDEPGPLSGTR